MDELLKIHQCPGLYAKHYAEGTEEKLTEDEIKELEVELDHLFHHDAIDALKEIIARRKSKK